MTREEAIYLLKNTAWLSPSLAPVDEAIGIVIEALENEETHDKHTGTHGVRFDLVLCKECKYYRPEFDACTVKGWNLSATHYPKVHESGFCYRGERRSDETN